ncbi:Mov34/MPN/PAD-1 family protein [Candidatus Magnetoovum chiemensis]|nr:Mov34/MPN/PAD-1 family protein [Candidatus Magnetoovum chiemensis]
MKITRNVIEKIFSHARIEYPKECCGIITGKDGVNQTIHQCSNIQDSLYEKEPNTYLWDSSIAYTIDRKEAQEIFKQAKQNGQTILAFYHSHPDHNAFFSTVDKAAQTVFGEPEFPDAAHIIVSVRNGTVIDTKCYKWNSDIADFVESALEIVF